MVKCTAVCKLYGSMYHIVSIEPHHNLCTVVWEFCGSVYDVVSIARFNMGKL